VTEAFLHYIWEHRLFEMKNLKTDDGLHIEVVHPGQYNTGAGPDFFNSRLRINGTLWAGNVEIHIHSSDWQRHNHHNDVAYDNCILHVVYENDSTTMRTDGSHLPAIELKNKLFPFLWENYLKLISNRGWIPCQNKLSEIDHDTWKITKERMIIERLENRATQIFISLTGNKDDWEECFYQYLARNFGFQLNAMPFEMLARSLPLKIIRKEGENLIDVEALLFGQAGMLGKDMKEEYPKKLSELYNHYSIKHSLKNIPFASWKLLRLRPVNFPALRIAQFSIVIKQCPFLFRTLTNLFDIEKIATLFKVTASEYWNTHYHFNKTSVYRKKSLGAASLNNLLINTCIPFLYAWGKYTGDNEKKDNALAYLNQLPSEENHLIDRWKETGVIVNSAVDTQALMQLKIVHCAEKKCLTCSIGNRLINYLQ
jgi:hypothetical protein